MEPRLTRGEYWLLETVVKHESVPRLAVFLFPT